MLHFMIRFFEPLATRLTDKAVHSWVIWPSYFNCSGYTTWVDRFIPVLIHDSRAVALSSPNNMAPGDIIIKNKIVNDVQNSASTLI